MSTHSFAKNLLFLPQNTCSLYDNIFPILIIRISSSQWQTQHKKYFIKLLFMSLIYILLSMCLSFTHLCQDVGQFFALPLSTDVCSQTAFQELQRPLILRHLKQFHSPFLVRCMPDYLPNQVPNKLCVFRLDTLQAWWTYLFGFGLSHRDLGRFVPLLETDRYFVAYSHAGRKTVLG